MFSSGNQGDNFGGFKAPSGNPFGHAQEKSESRWTQTLSTTLLQASLGIDRPAAVACPGSTAVNHFHANGNAPAVKTTFGQSPGFVSQPPLPPGGLAGAPPMSDARFGAHPPLAPGGLTGAPLTPSNGFNGPTTSGNPFGQTNKTLNNSSSTFGSTPFGQNGGGAFSTSTSAHTTFGSASHAGGSVKKRAPEFAKTPKSGFRDNGMATFGGNTAAFGVKEGGVGQTAFGAPPPKRGQSFFPPEPNGFGSSGMAAPTPSASQSTAFGSQASGVRVRKKWTSPNAATHTRADNPFAAAASGGSIASAPAIQTTFGTAVGSNNTKISPAFRKPFPADSAAPSTTFGKVSKNRRQTTPKSRSDTSAGGIQSLDQTEARRSGTKKASSSQLKRSQGLNTTTKVDANAFGGQHATSRYKQHISSSEDAFAGPKVSQTSEKHSDFRQARSKKKAPIASDEETPFVSMPSTMSSGKDESSKAQLSAATNLDGLCADMCSSAERELHIRVDELSVFEKCFPDQLGTERDMIVKRFQRSSADHKLDIPEEIRPPGVLRRTQLYIEQAIMDLDQCGLDPRFQPPRAPDPIELYNFCWDRFRMIRKDFVLQNYRGAGGRVHPIALDIHERIARYHILSEHELIETPSFVAQQNMEQLGQTLKSLNELYDESNKVGNPAYLSPFEAECRAYFILCTLDNGRGMDVLKYVKDLPHYILGSPHIKFAMRVFVARQTGDYYQFFSLLRQATYLQSCLLFRYIPNVRSSALLRMNRAFRSQIYPLEDLVELLCFDDIEHAYSVCQEHQLSIAGRPGAGDDSAVILKFGGSFQTDVQLRRSNTPLKIRSSKIYVGMKQGNYLRRDICRGVTEYGRDEYPALSKLIQDTELEERARLYPDRPMYEDAYSYFVNYNEKGSVVPSASAQARSVDSFSSQQQPAETGQTRHDLGMIAQRKLKLEQEKQAVLERMRKLEQAKEEKIRREKAKIAAAEEILQREEQVKQAVIAQARAEKEAAEAKRQQQELEAQLREQKKQRELEEQRKKAEEDAHEVERQRLAAIRQAEAIRIKAVEEEERRRQQEIRRKEAEQLERRRQRELAETLAREAREAALEAQRRAQIAKEQAERKRARRVDKQRLAILKLKLHLWMKYVRASRNGSGAIVIDATKLRLDRPHQKAKESMQWLFKGVNGAAGALVGTKRLKRLARTEEDATPSNSDVLALWCSDDVIGLVSAPLRRRNPGLPSIAWKLVIADLLDEASSSFGLWCAVRAGAQNASVPEHDCYCAIQSSNGMEQGIVVCSRYLDSTFMDRNPHEAQQDKLAATSAILLPVDLRTMQIAGKCSSWEQRIEDILSRMKAECQVTIFVLGFASTEIKSSRELLVNTLKSSIERVRSRFAVQVVQVEVDVIDAGDLLPNKFGHVLEKMAMSSLPVRRLKSVGLKELLEGSVKAMLNQFESSLGLQSNICAVFTRVRDEILTSGLMELAYPPPEVQFAIVEPPHGWNSQEKRNEIGAVLTVLEGTRVAMVQSPLNRDHTCDVYFKRIEEFIDQLFISYPAATAVSTYELKKKIYRMLLPVHECLAQDDKAGQVTPRDADALIPWRRIFEEIYETFFETLSDITIYYPADWRPFGANVADLLDAAVASSVTKQLIDSCNLKSKRACAVMKQPVQVSALSVRRSFGPVNAVDESKRKYQAVGELKRLRVEIDKERVAASQFQRMLRQALNRWDN